MRIKIKILLLIISTLLLILFVTTLYTHRVVERNHELVLREDSAKVVKQIESNFLPDGEATKLDELNESFKELMFLSSHIQRIDIFTFRPDGSLRQFFSKLKRPVGIYRVPQEEIGAIKRGGLFMYPEETQTGHYVNVVAPIHYRGGVMGLTEVKISMEEFDRLLVTKRQGTILVAVITIALIAGVLIVAINQMVNKPIENLLGAMAEVKGGNLDVRAEPSARDEIGKLTEHFNGMMETVRQTTAERESLLEEISRHNDELKYGIEKATEELRKRNEELSVANRSIYGIQKKLGHSRRLAAVGQMAATVAHELGTPLHSISGHLQLLLEEPHTMDSERRLKIMQSQLERITGSIRNLLNTTRQSDERIDTVDLNSLLDDITLLVLPETVSKRITVKKGFREGLPPVFGSRNRFEVVFLNLVDNAIDASDQGGVITISTDYGPAAVEGLIPGEEQPKENWVRAVISDTGRGIPEAYLKHIFEPFYTTKAHGHGTGLGLAISREIVLNHQGFISVDSKLNEGSVFTVYLPAA